MTGELVNCPNCGGSLTSNGGVTVCEFCGSRIGQKKPAGMPPVIKDVPRGPTQAPPQPPKPEPQPTPPNPWIDPSPSRSVVRFPMGCLKAMVGGLFVAFFFGFLGFRFLDFEGWQEAARDRMEERRERREREREREKEQRKRQRDERKRKEEAPFVPFMNFVNENGRLPNDEQGSLLLDSKIHTDGGGSLARYELHSRTRFALRKIGRDGIWWSQDDQCAFRDIPALNIKSDPELIAVGSIDDAKRSLSSTGPFQQNEGLRWLENHWKELEPDELDALLQLVVRLPNSKHPRDIEHVERTRTVKVVLAGLDKERQMKFAKLAESYRRHFVMLACIEYFAENQDNDSVLEFINCSLDHADKAINQLLRDVDIDPTKIRRRCIDDLDKSSRFVTAAKRLIDDPPAKISERQNIGKALIRRVVQAKSARQESLDSSSQKLLLKQYGDPSTALDLVDWLEVDSSFSSDILERLVEIQEAKSLEKLVVLMCDAGALPARIERALKKCGPELEPALLKQLPLTKEYYQEGIADLLARCGTERSLIPLDQIRKNSRRNETRRAAEQAIDRIVRAKRKPAEPVTAENQSN